MAKRQTLTIIADGFVRFCTLIISIALAYISSKLLILVIRPSNPYDIQNLYAPGGFNPEQNFAQIIWTFVFSLVFYWLLIRLYTKRDTAFKLAIGLVLIFSVFAIELAPRFAYYKDNMDTFHNGEQLAPSNDFNAGRGLYSDMYVLHGAGEDVVLPSLALRIAGENHGIGTYYFVTSALQFVSAALFIFLLALLFRNTALFLAVSLWFTFSAYSNFSYGRDIFIWSICLLALLAVFSKVVKHQRIAYFSIGVLSSLCLFYAFDRGVIAVVMAGIIGLVSLLFEQDKKGMYTVRLPKTLIQFAPALLIAAGFFLIQLLGMLIIGPSQYKEFLDTYFIDIPTYQGLLFNWPLPLFEESIFWIWLPIILVPFLLLMLVPLLKDYYAQKRFPATIVFALIITLAGLVFLRAGYGRYDIGHVSYSTPLIFVALFYVTMLYVRQYKPALDKLWLPVAVVALLFIPAPSLQSERLFALLNVNYERVKDYVTLPVSPDEKWTNDTSEKVAKYIRANTGTDDPIFVFTQQPIYYYLADRRNPTRFYVSWFADPTPLENEMLASLKKNKPKLIVYSSGDGWDKVDGFSMQERAPKVDKWLKANYSNKVKIGSVTLLTSD